MQKSGSASITIDNEIEDKKDLANALDLSASEDEEEVEDLVEYFTRRNARGEQVSHKLEIIRNPTHYKKHRYWEKIFSFFNSLPLFQCSPHLRIRSLLM